jgi:hypothetical protein
MFQHSNHARHIKRGGGTHLSKGLEQEGDRDEVFAIHGEGKLTLPSFRCGARRDDWSGLTPGHTGEFPSATTRTMCLSCQQRRLLPAHQQVSNNVRNNVSNNVSNNVLSATTSCHRTKIFVLSKGMYQSPSVRSRVNRRHRGNLCGLVMQAALEGI